jgi:glutamine amidotransferase
MANVYIIDYSIGNLFSVAQACKKTGLNPVITSKADDIHKADAVILPGVGAFAQGMKNLEANGMDEAIKHFVASGKPFMGICLGFQLLLEKSSEFEDYTGLGFVEGTVRHLRDSELVPPTMTVPKISWDCNKQHKDWRQTPFEGIEKDDDFYFVHSFYCDVEEPDAVLSTSTHGELEYCSAILKDNIFAMQFHPEKSAKKGLRIYENWQNLFLT